MPIYKYIKEFFILPGIFITIFAFLTLFLWVIYLLLKRNDKASHNGVLKITLLLGMLMCCVCSIGTYAISINAGSQRLMHYLEYMYPHRSIKPDAIILLAESTARTRTAVKLYKQYKVDVIPSGYKGSAENMAKFMRKNGVAVKNIILEKQATNTKEHVKYILPIAKSKGYKKVYLVTSAYHMPRSMMNFEKPFAMHGIEVIPYACDYRTPKEFRPSEHDWLPDMRYFYQSSIAWNEYLGMLELLLF